MTKIAKRLEAFGFTLQGMGGNCTAFVRTDGEIEELITLADDPTAPTKLTDVVVVGQGVVGEETEYTDGYTLTDVLAALENPSDEYVLLDLRLYNGFHKTNATV